MVDKKRRSSDGMRRMDGVVIRDQYRWLNQEGFLKAYDLRFIDSE